MPQYIYRGRDRTGQLRVGQRQADNIDILNNDLAKDGIFPISIDLYEVKPSLWERIKLHLQSNHLQLEELSIFSRQMQQLQEAGVPITQALKQLAKFTRSKSLAQGINGVIEYIEKGQNLANAMRHYPRVFTPLMITLVEIGENTGHLAAAFNHLHSYLQFELSNRNQLKTAFRYPLFIVIAITVAIVVLNIYVIPNFARFYSGNTMELPWQTRLLIGMSNVTIHYGFYILIAIGFICFGIYRYVKAGPGKYKWDKIKLKIPIFKNVMRHILLIRFSQALSIILNSGIPVNQGLALAKSLISNSYITAQISEAQDAIERGNTFTQAISKIDLFSTLEMQIISVGEKNGRLGPALNYISSFHNQEVEFELKRMNDAIGPILIAIVSGIILVIALGVYLPIWNMVNLSHT